MSLRPDRLRRFAQRSRDVVLASAVVGVITGLVVAGCEWLAQQMLDGIATLPDWLVVAAPGVGLVGAALALRFLAGSESPGLADTWLRAFHDPEHDQNLHAAPGAVLASILTIGLGGAVGLEGLSIYSGGAIGTFVQRRLRWLFGSADRRVRGGRGGPRHGERVRDGVSAIARAIGH